MTIMKLSNLIVTEKGHLKEDIAPHLHHNAIIGIHLWANSLYNQQWRNLKAMTWMLIQEEFDQSKSRNQ